jgi:hypothetical protein
MSDEHKLSQDVARGLRARALIEDELLAEAFAQLEAESIERWKSAADLAIREGAHSDVKALARLRGRLSRYLADGHLAERELRDLATRPKTQV